MRGMRLKGVSAIKLMKIVTLILLLLPKIAFAIPLNELPPIHIYVIEVVGDQGYGELQGLQMADYAILDLNKKLHLKLLVNGYESRKETAHVAYDDASRQAQLYNYEEEIELRSDIFTDLVLVITPPVWNGTDYFMGGWSTTECRWLASSYWYHGNRVSLVNVEPSNPQGVDRHKETVADIEHELLHLLGASHAIGDPNIMDPAALQYAANYPIGDVPISGNTKDQIRLCFDSPRARRQFNLPNLNYNINTGL